MRLGPAFPLTVLVAVTLGCAHDAPTAPTSNPRHPPPASAASNTLLPGPTTIIPLQRTAPLAANQQTSATVGLLGGTLQLPSAGLTIVVPPLAVLSPTSITVTALAGSNVAYEFAPHGRSFLVPLIAIQSLQNTEGVAGGPIDPLLLSVGYFPNSLTPNIVTELLSVSVNLLGQTATTLIWHFSGYVWSSGREESSSEGASDQ